MLVKALTVALLVLLAGCSGSATTPVEAVYVTPPATVEPVTPTPTIHDPGSLAAWADQVRAEAPALGVRDDEDLADLAYQICDALMADPTPRTSFGSLSADIYYANVPVSQGGDGPEGSVSIPREEIEALVLASMTRFCPDEF